MRVKSIAKRAFTVGLATLLLTTIPLPGFLNYNTPVAQAAQGSDDTDSNAKLNVRSKLMISGSSYTLKVYNLRENQTVSFKSDNTDILTVDQDGIMTAKDKDSNGTAIVTATIKEASKVVKTLECEITVGPAAVSIMLPPKMDVLTLEVDKKYPFLENILIIKPNTTVEIPSFSSSNTDVATISTTGKIAAKAIGTTKITATLENGSSVTCTLTVVAAETK